MENRRKIKVAALIVAAGRGERFGSGTPKQYARLGGISVLRRAAQAFLEHPMIDRVQAVIRPEDRALYDEAMAGLEMPSPVSGGTARQESAQNGLEALASFVPDIVLIHDAARPLASAVVISCVIAALEHADAAIPVMPVRDTLRRLEDSRLAGTVDREKLTATQTPQGFRFNTILRLHRDAAGGSVTDDAALCEAAGIAVAAVAGDAENMKITTAEDLALMEKLLREEIRTGSGWDVHRFGAASDAATLCGMRVPHTHALEGHSDADVGLHALTDALLGAVAAGDIGAHFPPSDPQWRGADSARFVTFAAELVAQRGGRIVNADITILCEAPKIAPHRDTMRARIAELLGVSMDRISVKATTTEKLGFLGRGEGIAAHAIVAVAFRSLNPEI